MSDGVVASKRLESWKEIASYIGKTERTAKRWEQTRGLPVRRVPGGGRQVVFAYPHELEAWLNGLDLAEAGEEAVDVAEPANNTGNLITIADISTFAPEHPHKGKVDSRSRRVPLGIAGITIALLTIVIIIFHRWTASPKYVLTGETQITTDGAVFHFLVTDGRKLYFSKWHAGKIAIFSMPVSGGEPRIVPTPFERAEPLSISPDGQRLLVHDSNSEIDDRETGLWIVPVNGDHLHRVGDFLCHTAEWAPDGRGIVYSNGTSVFLIESDSATPRLLHTFGAVPWQMRWSLDGKRLFVNLRDSRNDNGSIWELDLNDLTEVAAARPISIPLSQGHHYELSGIIDEGDSAFLGVTPMAQNGIRSLARSSSRPGVPFDLSEFTKQNTDSSGYALDRAGGQLFLARNVDQHSEFEMFDSKTRQFQPFLPGIAGEYIDFSRDGSRIAYVRRGNPSTLWISAPDGSSAHSVSIPQLTELTLPRWSPDGTMIALMGKQAGGLFRDYVVAASGGEPNEASQGDENQGAPTWSPDGKHLISGRVLCLVAKACSIYEIDLATKQETLLPGSEGLWTARWSPDGRWVAALQPEKLQVWLLDRTTRKWSVVAENINGNDLAWSADSKFLYASRPRGDRPCVIRFDIQSRQSESAVDLEDFTKLDGYVGSWFALTPTGSIIFQRNVGSMDIYALHYARK